jgi:hypothetical protein
MPTKTTTKKTTTKKPPVKKKSPRKRIIKSNKALMIVQKEMNQLGLPGTFFQSYEQQLNFYREQRDTVTKYISENLKEGVDYGVTSDQSKRKTLMKSGAEKIAAYMNCRVRFYNDQTSWQMLGNKNAVCFVAYLIDEKILKLITMALIKLGIEHEEQIVKLFAWGEGRGAYEEDETVYSAKWGKLAGKPLRGTYNRAIKLAEKRAETDLIIRVFGLDFAQDPELKMNDIREVYAIAMKTLNNADLPDEMKREYKYKIDNASNMTDIEMIIDEMKGHGTGTEKESLKLQTDKKGISLLNEVITFVNKEPDLEKKKDMMNEIIVVKENDEKLQELFKKYKEEL